MEKKKTNKTAKTAKTVKPMRTIDQLTIARAIAEKLNFKVSDVIAIIEEEQKQTIFHVRAGAKIVKKNYLTIEGRHTEAKIGWKSPLDGKTYDIPAKTRILVRVGDGFKRYVENRKMPEKLCRFVDSSATDN